MEIVTRAFYSLHDTRTPVVVGVAAMAVNAGLSLAFLSLFRSLGRPPFGGLALANSLATIAEMAVLLYLIYGRMGRPQQTGLPAAVGRMLLAAGLMAASLVGLIRLAVIGPPGLSVWWASLWAVQSMAASRWPAGAEEPRTLLQLVRRRLDR